MAVFSRLIVVGFGAAALWSGMAGADEPAAGASLQEIVVTAQKRAEGEQSVPLSMTTFGSAAIEQKAITSFFDYGTKVPNLAFAMTGDGIGTARTISIRGISGDNTTGFYIDETPLPDSIDPRVLDVDHIEVLRGPQGTLYGARSMGGTVRIITKEPELENFGGEVHAGVSHTWNTDRPNGTADGVVNIPILEGRVALRVSGFFDNEAGYFKRSYCRNIDTTAYNLNATPTCTPLSVFTHPSLVSVVNNVGALKTGGGAVALTIKATDNLTITPRVMLEQANYNGFPMADVLSDTSNGYGYPVPSGPYTLPTLKPTDFTQARMFDVPESGYDHWNLYSLAMRWKTSYGELVSSTAYFNRIVNETEDQADFVYAALLGGYQALPAAGLSEEKNYQRFVQEIRFASQLDGPAQFVVGGFYSDFHGRLPFASYYPPSAAPGYGNILLNVFGSCPPPSVASSGYLCPNPQHPDEIFGQNYRTDIKEPAVFGQLTYDFTPALKGTFGVRWSQVKTTAGGYIEGSVTESNADYYAGIGQIVDPNSTTTENSVTPKAQIDYHIDRDVMVYATAAKGFRPGGLVPSVPAALCESQLPAGVDVNRTRQYGSDSLWNYELGVKSSWLENRLTVNASAFYIDWKNIQQWILLGCGFQYRANAGAAVSKGGELEVNARPIEPLQLSLGLGYQDAKITSISASSDSPETVGEPVFETPDWTANASASWTQPVWASDRLVSSLDYSYVGRSFSANNLSGANGFATRERPSYALLNARIALMRNSWEVALVGKNIANEHANLADSRSIAAETPGRPRLIVNQPQTIGVEFRAHF
jgi:iron complex outermembrane receptor protein